MSVWELQCKRSIRAKRILQAGRREKLSDGFILLGLTCQELEKERNNMFRSGFEKTILTLYMDLGIKEKDKIDTGKMVLL